MALGTFVVLPELPLRPLPGLWINDGWHRDGNPLARRPPGPPLAIPRHAVFAATWAIGLVHIACLGPVVIRVALGDGVAEDLDHTTLRPAPVACLGGDDPLGSEPPLDGTRTPARGVTCRRAASSRGSAVRDAAPRRLPRAPRGR
jgi:hypothetical protein